MIYTAGFLAISLLLLYIFMPLYGHLPGFLLRGFLDFIIIIIPIILFLAYSKFSSFWIKDLSSLLPKSEAQLFPSFLLPRYFLL